MKYFESHAHYDDRRFREDREELLRELLPASGVSHIINIGCDVKSSENSVRMADKYDYVYAAVGVHPHELYDMSSQTIEKLRKLSEHKKVVAIGEIGLDYHFKREEQHRLTQHLWFLYQLNLAWKRKLPVILHVRDSHEDALRILRMHPARKLGGVIHCFYGSKEIAEQYLKLGYHIGIGGSVLQLEERAQDLWGAIPHIPLERILLETDAPFILPYCKDVIQPKLLRRARNTSLILPAVIEKIAELKGISADEVEQATTENTIRLFHLPIHET